MTKSKSQSQKLDELIVQSTRQEERLLNLALNFEEYKKSCVETNNRIENVITNMAKFSGFGNGNADKSNSLYGMIMKNKSDISQIKSFFVWAAAAIGTTYAVMRIVDYLGWI